MLNDLKLYPDMYRRDSGEYFIRSFLDFICSSVVLLHIRIRYLILLELEHKDQLETLVKLHRPPSVILMVCLWTLREPVTLPM